MAVPGCVPASKVATITTLTTRAEPQLINDCAAATEHSLVFPRMGSTVIHSHANSYIFGKDIVTKTSMIPVSSSTSWSVCMVTADCGESKSAYPKIIDLPLEPHT
ncbi:unnamed protein product [Meganyctiphanes norvegica]|uniref:Uncharacterized protein n=1 Tax=Meganyctiphanes norvegica TaxID=48144 RepID=A0AAV2STZ8_MEGNR